MIMTATFAFFSSAPASHLGFLLTFVNNIYLEFWSKYHITWLVSDPVITPIGSFFGHMARKSNSSELNDILITYIVRYLMN